MSNIKWTEDELIAEAQKYTTRKEFQNANQSAYSAIAYRGIKDKCFAHMPAMAPRKWTKEKLIEEVAKYDSKVELREKSRGAYEAIKKRKLIPELLGHFKDTKLESQVIPIPSKETGLYILFEGSTIVYVGKSNRCIMDRIRKHTLKTGVEYKAITKVKAYVINNQANLDVAEVYLINKYKPEFNSECNSNDAMTIEIANLDSIIDQEYHLELKEDKWTTIHS